jgi:acetyl/propionyl-CoA carboxylase alpha subunit
MQKLNVLVDGQAFTVEIGRLLPTDTVVTVLVNGTSTRVQLPDNNTLDWFIVNGRPYEVDFDRDLHWLKVDGALHRLEVRDAQTAAAIIRSGDGRVKAPIPGLITRLKVEVGQSVEAGQSVATLEAMKMENDIRAARNGTVTAIQVTIGQIVTRNQVLLEIE